LWRLKKNPPLELKKGGKSSPQAKNIWTAYVKIVKAFEMLL
jgi:hypothetical protein